MNPMQMMMRQMMGGQGMPAMDQMPMIQGMQQRPHLDKNKMKRYIGSIDDVQLNNLAEQARAQGISDADIEEGLSFLRRLRK